MVNHISVVPEDPEIRSRSLHPGKSVACLFGIYDSVRIAVAGYAPDTKGGYFVSFYAFPGTATKVVAMCKEAGVALTPAGASYPYGKDPDDSNIRLCPSFPPVENIIKAVSILSVCAKITAIDKLLEE